MQKLILLVMVLAGGFSTASAQAEERLPPDRVIDRYEQCMAERDWESAQVIAYGVHEICGTHNRFACSMSSGVRDAKALDAKLTQRISSAAPLDVMDQLAILNQLVQPRRPQLHAFTYLVDDLIPPDDVQSGYKMICAKLRKAIDVKESMDNCYELKPLATDLSFVASGTLKQHKQILAALAQLRQEKQQANAQP